MLGIAKIILNANGGTPPSSSLSVFVTPETVNTQTSNGGYTSPYFIATASGGNSPYTYEWTISDPAFTIITSSTDNRVRVSVSGTNELRVATLTCKVTDDSANTKSGTATLAIAFGNQLL